MMNESNTRKQDGADGWESFDLTEWLKNEVKLPQYRDAFLHQGFELPVECSSIDEAALDALGVVKIGHRKRLLVSCQKLADKWGILPRDLAKPVKSSDTSSEAKEQQAISSDYQSPNDLEPPVLPPKKSRPAPPPRNMAEQEVSIDKTLGESSKISVENRHNSIAQILNLTNTESTLLKTEEIKPNVNAADFQEGTDSETNLSPGLPAGEEISEYEPLWEASEGKPLPLSPVDPTQEAPEHQVEPINNNASLDRSTSAKIGINNIELCKEVNAEVQIPCSATAERGPPPIPPRADLDDLFEKELQRNGNYPITGVTNAITETTEPKTAICESKSSMLVAPEKGAPKRKIPPAKPPRKNKPKPISMLIQPGQQLEYVPKHDRRSLGSVETKKAKDDAIYENEVFSNPALGQVGKTFKTTEGKRSVFDRLPTVEIPTSVEDDNLYDNVESFPKAPVHHTLSGPELSLGSEKNKRPIPVPRARSLSEKPKVEDIYDTIADKSAPTVDVKPLPRVIESAAGNDGGSCTEDDLSGSDREEMPEEVSSEYETVNFPSRVRSMVQSRHATKEGYLFKQGGQQNNKGWKKRWVVFDGSELRYFKDKDHTDESLQMVPVAIMREVRIVTEDTKRARFDLACAGRTYMFALGTEEMDVIQVWAQILMSAIIQVRKENETNISQAPGGDMFEPDKKGFLKKQGNNVVADWKKRYVAVKDGMFAYYHNYEDFIVASPINTIQMNLASVKVDPKSPNRFQLVTPHRTYLFQCEDEEELRSWTAALEKAIQLALSDRTVIDKVWENPSNRMCADCGERDPVWASVNLVVCVCARCIGVHRNLGVHASKPRSLLMDEKIWSPSLIQLMVAVGNDVSNRFWQYRIPEDDRISPDSTSESRKEFIHKKYVQRMYRHVSPLYGDPVALGEALKQAVCTNDVESTMQLVFCGADVKYISSDGSESRTPYELAEQSNQELQMEFLLQNGAITYEPEPVHSPDPITTDNTYEDVSEIISPSFDHASSIPIVYEKEGFLFKKAPSAAVWRKRYFMLKGRELWYDKGDKDGHSLIKLKDVEEYVHNDSLTLDIVTPERTYNLRADTKEDAFGWYTALRNKQVFQVRLEYQELGSDGIPHLVAKSLHFVEAHGLEAEGIYRKNGNKAKIRTLKKLFNQDAESVMILREEYEAHDVAGLLKEYFRELPDPLMTEDAYPHFITASLTPDHNDKLNLYKNGLGRLREVNRTTLKAVISHLVRISSHSHQNKMKLENISLIFGPTLMSNQQMGAMDTNTINQEFTVIGDFITYYKWLFDVGDDEVQKDQKIAEAMKQLSQMPSKSNMREFNELTLDIYALRSTNECSRITVYTGTKASEICQQLVSKRAMAPDLNWVLFQSVNEEIERPFPAMEKVLATVVETGKYTQLNKGSCLVVKENYIQQKLQAYALQSDTSLTIAGSYQTMKEAKRKENWKRLFIKLEKGVLTVHKNVKTRDDIDNWPLSETTLYIGVDRDKKPLTGYGFTIVRIGKDGQCVYRYICFEEERDQFRWINILLKLKYPGVVDLWTDPELEPIGYYAEAIIPVKVAPTPRQRTPSNNTQISVSANILNELKEKQLRKSVRQ